MLSVIRKLVIAFPLVMGLLFAPVASATTIDTVILFAPGSGFGVIPGAPGTFVPSAVTALDGISLALGGTAASPGQIIVGFSTGTVINGPGADLRLIETNGISEGIIVEASVDGTTFFPLGSYDGQPSRTCSLGVPCNADFDLAAAGLGAASIFRLTATEQIFPEFPQAYDLDTVEALNFQPSPSPVPLPAPVLLLGMALGVLGALRWFKRRTLETA
jgi:hypothetical protein